MASKTTHTKDAVLSVLRGMKIKFENDDTKAHCYFTLEEV